MRRDSSRADRPWWPIVRSLLLFSGIAAWLVGVAKATTGHLTWTVTSAGIGLLIAIVAVIVTITQLLRINGEPGPWRVFLIVALPALSGLVVVAGPAATRITWTVVLFLGGIALVRCLAAEFSGTFLRVALIAFLIGMVALVALIGRDALVDQRTADARAKATALDVELATLTARATKARADATAAATKAADQFEAAVGTTALGAAAATAAVAELRSAIERGSSDGLTSPAPDLDSMFDAARAAIDKIPAPLNAAPMQRVTLRLCTGAGGELRARDGEPARLPEARTAARCHRVRASRLGARELVLRSALAERAMADLDAANGPADATGAKKRQEAAVIALDDATEARSESPPTVSFVSAISAGGNELVSWLPGVGSAPIDLELQVAGWAVIGIIAIYFARAMAWRSADRNVGPVKISTPEGMDKADVAAFTVQLIKNVPEPSTLPGTTASDPVTDLIAAAADGASGIAKALNALSSLFRPAARFEVELDLVGPDGLLDESKPPTSAVAASGEVPPTGAAVEVAENQAPSAISKPSGTVMYECVVRVNDVRRGSTLMVFESPSVVKREALGRAAYVASGWIVRHSDVVAPWAVWEPNASFKIADWQRAESAIEAIRDRCVQRPDEREDWKQSIGTQKKLAKDALIEASARAPHNAVLAQALLDRTTGPDVAVVKLERAARTAADHPRFVQSRYSIAAWLAVIAGEPELWWRVQPGMREDCIYALNRVRWAAGLGDAADATNLRVPSAGWTSTANRIASEHLRDLEDLCSRSRMLFNALRRDERTYWLPRARRKSRVKLTAETLRYFVRVRAGDQPASPSPERYSDAALALVNLACAYLLNERPGGADPRQALDFLEEARDAYGGSYLTRHQLEDDPDLKPLSGNQRFEALLSTLRPGESDDR